MTVSFEQDLVIGASPEVVFDLALDVDVHLQSQAGAGEQAIAGVTSGRMGLGDEVTWRATHFRVPFTMTSRITELERPRRFVDEQVRGPFRRWYHEHRFEPSGSRTRMIDRVSFDAPAGPLGWMAERLVLERYLHRLIADRGEHLRRAAEQAR